MVLSYPIVVSALPLSLYPRSLCDNMSLNQSVAPGALVSGGANMRGIRFGYRFPTVRDGINRAQSISVPDARGVPSIRTARRAVVVVRDTVPTPVRGPSTQKPADVSRTYH